MSTQIIIFTIRIIYCEHEIFFKHSRDEIISKGSTSFEWNPVIFRQYRRFTDNDVGLLQSESEHGQYNMVEGYCLTGQNQNIRVEFPTVPSEEVHCYTDKGPSLSINFQSFKNFILKGVSSMLQ